MKYFVFSALVFLLSGCGSLFSPDISLVKGNTYFSSKSPKLKVIVDGKMSYLGENKESKSYDNGNNARWVRHIFADYDENSKIKSGVEILTADMTGPGNWLSDIFGQYKKDTIIRNNIITQKDGRKFNQVLLIDYMWNVSFYTEKGYICPSKGIVRGLARNFGTDSKTQFMVWYWEDLDIFNKKAREELGYSFVSWTKYDVLTADQRTILNKFITRADEAFQIAEITKTDEIVFGTAEPNVMIAPQNASEKLVALKKLKDEGIISEQEYENKKKEILDNF